MKLYKLFLKVNTILEIFKTVARRTDGNCISPNAVIKQCDTYVFTMHIHVCMYVILLLIDKMHETYDYVQFYS